MDQLRLFAENAVLVHRREHIEMRADGDDDVGLGRGAIGAGKTVAAQRTQRQRMRGRERVGRILQHGDRDAGAGGEFFHRGNGVFLHHAAADHEQRALGFGDQRPCGVELRRVAYRQYGVAIRGGCDGFGRRLPEQHFTGGLDVRRALRLGQRDAEGLAHRFLHLFDIGNAVGPLGDRAHERDLVHVLRRIAFAHDAFLHAADADHRHVAAKRGADGGDDVGHARAFSGGNDGGLAGRARKAVRHERGALLVARQDEADLRRVAQRVEDREVLRAGNAEDVVDAFAQQSVDQRARAGCRVDLLVFAGIHCNAFSVKCGCPVSMKNHGRGRPAGLDVVLRCFY